MLHNFLSTHTHTHTQIYIYIYIYIYILLYIYSLIPYYLLTSSSLLATVYQATPLRKRISAVSVFQTLLSS